MIHCLMSDNCTLLLINSTVYAVQMSTTTSNF